jgi:hypothetical protein
MVYFSTTRTPLNPYFIPITSSQYQYYCPIFLIKSL